VKNIKNCLSAILRHAHIPDGYIESNPARGVLVPRPEDETAGREPDPFTWDERAHIEGVFREHYPRFYPLVLCGFRTGMRIGELIGLQWQDIDFFNKMIFIQRNVTRCKITTTKSRSSKRMVRMTSVLASVLQEHKTRMKSEKIKKGWAKLPEWVFHNEEGGFLNYGNFMDRVWNRGLDKSSLRRRTPHDMRHTYATLRLSKGDSLAEVSKEMGHSTTDITYRTYYKWLPKESRSNIDELDGITPADATIRNLSATEN
jgi:integrase